MTRCQWLFISSSIFFVTRLSTSGCTGAPHEGSQDKSSKPAIAATAAAGASASADLRSDVEAVAQLVNMMERFPQQQPALLGVLSQSFITQPALFSLVDRILLSFLTRAVLDAIVAAAVLENEAAALARDMAKVQRPAPALTAAQLSVVSATARLSPFLVALMQHDATGASAALARVAEILRAGHGMFGCLASCLSIVRFT